MSDREKIKNGFCPSCESGLIFQEGCILCPACGWAGCDG